MKKLHMIIRSFCYCCWYNLRVERILNGRFILPGYPFNSAPPCPLIWVRSFAGTDKLISWVISCNYGNASPVRLTSRAS